LDELDYFTIAGVDEAGRGPLAGPVSAAAVVLPSGFSIPGLTDSKLLTHTKRLKLRDIIMAKALHFSVAEASVEEIDQLNILQASLLAMQRALLALKIIPNHVLIDGNQLPPILKLKQMQGECVIDGDKIIPAISAASILAKVARDELMLELDKSYPEYSFAKHKGYGTKLHLEALRKYGASLIHRKSFAPVRACLIGV
jgi:ribonuclease HII